MQIAQLLIFQQFKKLFLDLDKLLGIRKRLYPIAKSVPLGKLMIFARVVNIDKVLVVKSDRSHLIVA